MNIENRKLLILGVAATVIILATTTVVAMLVTGGQKEYPAAEPSQTATNEKQAGSIDDTAAEVTGEKAAAVYTYNNLDGLYFIPSWEYDGFKSSIEDFLEVIGSTDISTIKVLDEITTDDDVLYTFWVQLSDNKILRGAYNYDLDNYAFEIETSEATITKFIDTNEPDGIDDPDISYVYADLTISNLAELETVLSGEAFQRFSDELISFLDSQNELRRYFTLSSIVQSDTSTSWTCLFDTARIDGLNVYVTYSTDDNAFTFTLQ